MSLNLNVNFSNATLLRTFQLPNKVAQLMMLKDHRLGVKIIENGRTTYMLLDRNDLRNCEGLESRLNDLEKVHRYVQTEVFMTNNLGLLPVGIQGGMPPKKDKGKNVKKEEEQKTPEPENEAENDVQDLQRDEEIPNLEEINDGQSNNAEKSKERQVALREDITHLAVMGQDLTQNPDYLVEATHAVTVVQAYQSSQLNNQLIGSKITTIVDAGNRQTRRVANAAESIVSKTAKDYVRRSDLSLKALEKNLEALAKAQDKEDEELSNVPFDQINDKILDGFEARSTKKQEKRRDVFKNQLQDIEDEGNKATEAVTQENQKLLGVVRTQSAVQKEDLEKAKGLLGFRKEAFEQAEKEARSMLKFQGEKDEQKTKSGLEKFKAEQAKKKMQANTEDKVIKLKNLQAKDAMQTANEKAKLEVQQRKDASEAKKKEESDQQDTLERRLLLCEKEYEKIRAEYEKLFAKLTSTCPPGFHVAFKEPERIYKADKTFTTSKGSCTHKKDEDWGK